MAEVARPRAGRVGQVGPLLRRTGKSCCREQLPGSRTRKCHVGSWCTPRDYSMGQRRLAPRKGPETNLCMDRRQSEARICSARGMRLLTAANSEARWRKREASPETAARESPVVRRKIRHGIFEFCCLAVARDSSSCPSCAGVVRPGLHDQRGVAQPRPSNTSRSMLWRTGHLT